MLVTDDYNALEPYISSKIMELHHKKHHQTYVTGLNTALENIAKAEEKGDFTKAASIAPLLNFHGGGHVNHSLFWENLAPASREGGGEPKGDLKVRWARPRVSEIVLTCVRVMQQAIEDDFGSFEDFRKQMNTTLAGIQGSGWAWLVKDKESDTLSIVTRANQDPVTGAFVPLLGIDAWEHAYYLQYENRKAEYFDAIWNIINWKTVAKRYD